VRRLARYFAMSAALLIVPGAAGATAPAAHAVVRADIPVLPGPPSSLSTQPGHQVVGLSFLPAQAGTSPITGYEVSLDGGATWRPLATPLTSPYEALSASVGGLLDGHDYLFTVRAVSAAGPGASSRAVPTTPRLSSVLRLEGPDRIATAIAVSRDSFPVPASAGSAVVTSTLTYADALSGANLAAQTRGPLLLTPPGALDAGVAAEIDRALAPGATVYVLGETGVLSSDVERSLRRTHPVVRLAGSDRFTTAIAVADRLRSLGSTGPVHLATGLDFPDGLALTPLAAQHRGVVLLSYGTTLDAATKAWIDREAPQGHDVWAVGDQASRAIENTYQDTDFRHYHPVAGNNRYDTARLVAERLADPPVPGAPMGVATGVNWPDALAAAAAAGFHGQQLLLTGRATFLEQYTADHVSWMFASFQSSGAFVYGGADVVPDTQLRQIAGYLAVQQEA
jgi:putative cell wall-binding protein